MNKSYCSNKSILTATLVIILFTLLTLADASAPISGIHDISIKENQLFAKTIYEGTYFSEDGGLTWTDCAITSKCHETDVVSLHRKLVSIPESNIQYRITENGMIETSHDIGLTWARLSGGNFSSEVSTYYQLQTRANAVVMNPGAQDLQYDPASGNVLFAMGLQGVLVITNDGEIIQVGVGDNQPAKLNNPLVFFSIIFPFLLLAAAFIAICYGTLITISRHYWYWVLNLSALIVWAFIARTFQNTFSGYGIVIGLPSLGVFVILLVLIWIKSESTLNNLGKKDKQHKLYFLRKVMPGGPAYFACYLFWYLTIIPKWKWALYSSLSIALGWFIYCIIQSYKWKNSLGESGNETI